MSGNSFWGSLTSGLSNFADGVGDLFNVGSTVSTSSNIKPDDVLKTKTALNAVGSYDVPDFGITDIPDTGMIDGLKDFQANNGLKVDGVMKPGGPTENALGQTLANQGISTTDMLEKVKTPSITPMPDMPKPVSPPQTSWSASAPLGEVPKPSRPKLPKIDPMTGLEDPLASAPKGKMPTKKQWEEVAKMQQQNAKMAIIPQGDTVDQRIRSMMADKRYGDKHDTRLREHVQKQFQNAYPGNLEYDETGKMIQPTAFIRPQDVQPFDRDGELKSMEMFNDQNEETVAQGHRLQSTDGQDTPAQTTDAKPIFYLDKNRKAKSAYAKSDGTFVDVNGQPVGDVPDWVTKLNDKSGYVDVASNNLVMNDASTTNNVEPEKSSKFVMPEIPANKSSYAQGYKQRENYTDFFNSVSGLPDVTQDEVDLYMDIFAQEGFLVEDNSQENGRVTVAGIMETTVDNYGPSIGIPKGTEPKDLTNIQRAKLYRAFFGENKDQLLQLKDKKTRHVIADMMFRGGEAGTMKVAQPILNEILGNKSVTVDGIFGSQTVKALNKVFADEKNKQKFLDKFYAGLFKIYPSESNRFKR